MSSVVFNPLLSKKIPQKEDYFSKLPNDILYEIFASSLLPTRDIHAISATCKRFYYITQNSNFYRLRVLTTFNEQTFSSQDAELRYKKDCYLENNFWKGVYVTKNAVKIPDLFLNKIDKFKVHKDKAFICLNDGTIEVYDILKNKYSSLKMYTQGMSCFKIKKDLLFSGSFDGSVQINTLNGSIVKKLAECSGWISSMEPKNNIFFTGSYHGFIRIWNTEKGTIEIVKAHKGPVSVLVYFNKHLFSTSFDGEIKKWDEAGNLKACFIGHSNEVISLKAKYERIYSGSMDATVRIWNQEGTLLSTLSHSHSVLKIKIKEDKIFSSSIDRKINIWTLDGKILRELQFDNAIRKFKIKKGLLIAADGSKVKIIDLERVSNPNCLYGNRIDKDDHIIDFKVLNDKIIAAYTDCLMIWDFNQPLSSVLNELARTFLTLHDHDAEFFNNLLHRFSVIPEKDKNEIYEELFLMIKKSLKHGQKHLKFAQDAFMNQNNMNTTHLLRAIAITKYLGKKPYTSKKVQKKLQTPKSPPSSKRWQWKFFRS